MVFAPSLSVTSLDGIPGTGAGSADDYLVTAFRSVGADAALQKVVHCLRFQAGLPSFRNYKAVMLERLGVGQRHCVIDVGCGLGSDVIQKGVLVGQGGRAVGIDTSAALVALARENAPDQGGRVQSVVGDGAALPLGSYVADAVKIDRTLQHVAQPQAVVDDVYRVLRVGGRGACAESDWATLTITSDDVDTTRLVAQ